MGDEKSSRDLFRRFARTVLAHRKGGHSADQDAERAREVYQSSTMGALMEGVYDGDVTVGELLRHGDFGVGTFNHLDGEMLVLGGVCYHLRADGSVEVADGSDLTPFAALTWFSTEQTAHVSSSMNRAELTAFIDELIRSENLMYAVRITGHFAEVRTRTVREQTPPYPPLTDATRGQAETTFTDITGTLAGYRTPDYEQGIGVAGYHLHFLDETHTHGGHSIEFRITKGRIEIAARPELHLSLPNTPEFLDSDLTSSDLSEKIRQAEGE
ncbi:acetolactate decarboxylase [Streptomyces sp. NPDC004393]|uniref:acetolactate decarboxylase n=1 Tax=unclassified Streptomyces TaxID=2593676 RepID=UPI0033AC94C3